MNDARAKYKFDGESYEILKRFGKFVGKRKEKDIYLKIKGLKIKISDDKIKIVYVKKLNDLFEYRISEIDEEIAKVLEDAIGVEKVLEKEREIFEFKDHIVTVDKIKDNMFFVIQGENPEKVAKELGLKEKFTRYFSELK